MCAGAGYWSRLERIVFGALDDKKGYSIISPDIPHPKTIIQGGVLALECTDIIQEFFRKKRE
jgi:tRNA(adenine34) deaminase